VSSPGASSAFAHQALFYDTDDQLLSTVVPFVREGLDRDEMVVVNLEPATTDVLASEIRGHPRVRIGDTSVYSSPAATLNTYQQLLRESRTQGSTGLRCVGRVDFTGQNLPWQDWLRYESLINHVFASDHLRGLCPYDLRRVPPHVAEGLRRSHPEVHEPAGGPKPNAEYVDPAAFLEIDDYATPPAAIEDEAPAFDVDDVTDLAALRLDLGLAMVTTDLHRSVVTDFGYAVNEVAANAITHGAPPVRVRTWTGQTEIVAKVTDHGQGIADRLTGYRRPKPGGDATGTHGLWAARQLCDELDFGHDEDGFTVRLAVGS
jgi:anti-sigma regulatory factor (Ser/Thr protein kinase)